jgi:hypothetical protein
MSVQCLPIDPPPTGVRSNPGICVGQISLSLEGSLNEQIRLGPGLEPFRDHAIDSAISITVEWQDRLPARGGKAAFDSGGVWNLFHQDCDFVFDFSSLVISPCPYKRLRMDRQFRAGQLTLSREALESHVSVCPLEYPADELLFTNYLAHHALGAEVHGCGMIDPKHGGFLFLGHSGAGKTTTTRLWKSVRNPEILSDDRIILRIHDRELWMYGTPWHGEAAFASPAKARLNRIFILQHGAENKMVELSPARAVGELFARCFPPFHSAHGLSNTLEFLHRVVDIVPCYEFHFLPHASAIAAAVAFHG